MNSRHGAQLARSTAFTCTSWRMASDRNIEKRCALSSGAHYGISDRTIMADLSQLQPGLTGKADLLVGVEHTAPSIGSGLVPVLATPVMINLIEAAALAAAEHLLPAGYQSLGIHLD